MTRRAVNGAILGATLLAGAAAPASLQPLGRLATLAPLCGLRSQAWADDLRLSIILDAGEANAQQAAAALSFAESQALEEIAQTPDQSGCQSLALDPALAVADRTVETFHSGR